LAQAKKYQIFLSSTFVDLKTERQDAIGVILDLGHIPAGMEMFPASDVNQLDHIKRIIDQCDYYVLILAARYGSTDEAGISFTEREYDYAVEQGKVVLAFPHATPAELTKGADVDRVAADKFEKFRQKIMQGRLVKPWAAREELNSKVIIALHHAITDFPQAGWIRGDVVASEEILTKIVELQSENDNLNKIIEKLKSSQKPIIENLADLDDQFAIHYMYNDNGRKDREVRISWSEIWKVIGPAFFEPSVPEAGNLEIIKHIKEKYKAPYNSSILTSDENTIRLHFIALGFLSSKNSQSHGGGVREFITTTDLGKNKLLELSAVRKSK
jgi:hypothetical protein